MSVAKIAWFVILLNYSLLASNWNTSDFVEADTDTFSVALDSKEKLHIAYVSPNGDLMYATNMSGQWVHEIAVSNPDYGIRYVALAVDSTQKVHISYDYKTNLWYATNKSGSWSTELIDNGNTGSGNETGYGVGYRQSIDIDSDGYVHICYRDAIETSTKYITNHPKMFGYKVSPNSTFISDQVDGYDKVIFGNTGTMGHECSIKVSKGNQQYPTVHICYNDLDTGALKYAYVEVNKDDPKYSPDIHEGYWLDGLDWNRQVVDKDLDPEGYVTCDLELKGLNTYIVYSDTEAQNLKLVSSRTSSPEMLIGENATAITTSFGFYPNLLLTGDTPMVSYYGEGEKVMLATKIDNQWNSEVVGAAGNIIPKSDIVQFSGETTIFYGVRNLGDDNAIIKKAINSGNETKPNKNFNTSLLLYMLN